MLQASRSFVMLFGKSTFLSDPFLRRLDIIRRCQPPSAGVGGVSHHPNFLKHFSWHNLSIYSYSLYCIFGVILKLTAKDRHANFSCRRCIRSNFVISDKCSGLWPSQRLNSSIRSTTDKSESTCNSEPPISTKPSYFKLLFFSSKTI